MFHPAIDLAMIFVSIMLTAAGLAAEGKPEPGGIIGNTYLFFTCMSGSGIGAALYIAINAISFKVLESTPVRSIKFLCSFAIGGVFTPWFIRHYAIDQSAETVLALSTLVGLVGWGVIMTLMPWAFSFFPNAIKALFKNVPTNP